ncbi:MAG: hypothetical protein Q9159_004294 [Coniocarpon cinnabarinum]
MSSNLMDTEPGGESTQYETVPTAQPHSKSTGTLGSTSSQTKTAQEYAPAPSAVSDSQKAARGEKTAENIRYGQGISEQAGVVEDRKGEGGYGRVERDIGGERDEEERKRKIQGYGGERGMRSDVGG